MKPTPLAFFADLLNQKKEANPLISHVAIDSRQVLPDTLFFALPGKKTDGHLFLKDVALSGGKAAVVHETYQGPDFGLTLFPVPHVLKSLQEMARKVLKSRRGHCKVVAISGSIGKTTTKEFTKTLLSAQFPASASPKSYNTESTLPLTILMADFEEKFLVLEMGMTRPGDIAELISIAPPDIALLTTCAVQHAINFPKGLEGIVSEKATLFSHPETSLGLLFRDMPHFDMAAASGNCIKKTFSLKDPSADYFLQFLSSNSIMICSREESIEVPWHLPAPFFAHNVLAAVAIAHSCGLSLSFIQKHLSSLQLPPMRFEKVEKQGIVFINDAYNANPDSVVAALKSLPVPRGGRRIAVLSEMNALGSYSHEGHSLVAHTALNHADILLGLGQRAEIMISLWKENNKEAYFFITKEELIVTLKKMVMPGDVVLLKGARAYSFDKILDYF